VNVKDIKTGLRVTITNLRSPVGILAGKFLNNRRLGEGVVEMPVGDHPNAWWVKHPNRSVAPYWYDEFEPSTKPPPPNPFTEKPFPD
jgi:hypothetical protein